MNDEKEPAAASLQEQTEEELSKAFHFLCDPFPEPVALCHLTHRVIAVNPAAEKYGRTVGSNCAKGCPALKAGLCRQAHMVKKGKATWIHLPDSGNGHPSTSYWIPVAGHPDYYWHFGIGTTTDYAKNPTEE